MCSLFGFVLFPLLFAHPRLGAPLNRVLDGDRCVQAIGDVTVQVLDDPRSLLHRDEANKPSRALRAPLSHDHLAFCHDAIVLEEIVELLFREAQRQVPDIQDVGGGGLHQRCLQGRGDDIPIIRVRTFLLKIIQRKIV